MTKTDEPEFMIGQGFVGAILLDIIGGPCLRLDDKRWSMNTARGNLILSQAIVDRLLAKTYVAIAPEKLMDRELLVLTEEGTRVVCEYALWRSFDIAANCGEPMYILSNVNDSGATSTGAAYDLAAKAFDLHAGTRIGRGEEYVAVRCPGTLMVVDIPEGKPQSLHEFLSAAKTPAIRASLLFHLIKDLAESSMYGLTIGNMPDVAEWAALIASEAFRRAPDQDWEIGGEGDGA